MMQHFKVWTTLLIVAMSLPFLANKTALADEQTFKTDVFVSGTGGYHTYRIPAVIVTPKGTVLAFCEGRKTSRSDHGDLDLVLRRSTDDGKTWTPLQIVYEEGGDGEDHDRQSLSGGRSRYGAHLVALLPEQRRRAGHDTATTTERPGPSPVRSPTASRSPVGAGMPPAPAWASNLSGASTKGGWSFPAITANRSTASGSCSRTCSTVTIMAKPGSWAARSIGIPTSARSSNSATAP